MNRLVRGLAALAASVVVLSGAAVTHASSGAAAVPHSTFTNPVTAGTVDTFPDPTVVRAHDGAYYAYGTTNPIFNSSGETREHVLPMLRSTDLTHWDYQGDVWPVDGTPTWWPAGTRAWAPDIRYIDGVYHLTYALSTGGIALATSDAPAGPWTDRGLIVPGSGSGCPSGTIDPAVFTDTDGTHYLYWGSYDTICVSRMNADATALVGDVTQVGRGRRMEGAYVVHRGAYYYLMYSDGGCCDGAFSGYTMKAGRSTSPLGPFVTPSGLDLMALTSKDGIVGTATGNGWIGPGHNAVITDLSGQDWLVYHGIPEANPDFPPVTGANGATLTLSRRPMLIDRLDWIDGWPVLRAGKGPSATPQRAPVTTWRVGSTFDSADVTTFTGDWTQSDGVLSAPSTPATQLSRRSVAGDLDVQADLRGGTAGLVLTGAGRTTTITVDRAAGELVIDAETSGGGGRSTAPLPADYDWASWHTLDVQRRGTQLTASLSADGLNEPLATVSATSALPDEVRFGVVGGADAQADNVGAAQLYTPVTERAVADPHVGRELAAYSDDFDGTGTPGMSTNSSWHWVRDADPNAQQAGGALSWPTQNAELSLGTNTAKVLLRRAPDRDYLAETKVQLDPARPGQQAGLILYGGDDHFLKLAHSAIPLNNGNGAVLQQTEFTKETSRPTYTPPLPVASGPMFGGPAATTEWLRLAYHYDKAGNRDVARMASSIDGHTWTWGGTWTMPHTDDLQLGLISYGGAGVTASFDYLHTYATG